MSGFHRPPEVSLRHAAKRNHDVQTTSASAKTTSDTYRAAVVTELGQPLTIQQLPVIYPHKAQLKDGMVKVKVEYAAINFGDILKTQGKYQRAYKPPFTPGQELSGVVSAIGPGVSNVKVGDRVFGLSPDGFGAFAEEVIVKAQRLEVIPDTIPLETAASFLIAYATSYIALVRGAHTNKGDTVLVTAAAGATGLAAVDLAANVFGCKVIAACGSDVKCNVARTKGATASINYNKESLKERMKEITKGLGANIIFECVGGKLFRECLSSISFEGTIIPIGFASGEIPSIPANLVLVKNIKIAGIWLGAYLSNKPVVHRESVDAVGRYLEEGKIKPSISKVFPLAQVNEAMKYISDRKSTGKVLLRMND